MRARHVVPAALVLVLLLSCAPAATPAAGPGAAWDTSSGLPGSSAPGSSVPGSSVPGSVPVQPSAAVDISARLLAGYDAVVPELTGMSAAGAAAVLSAAGADLEVVELDPGGVVTAQYPAPGAALPDGDRAVVVWIGSPPAVEGRAERVVLEATPTSPEPIGVSGSDGVEPGGAEPGPAGGPSSGPAAGGRGMADAGGSVDNAGTADAWRSPGAAPRTGIGAVIAGLASWYGPGFEGKATGCGSTFDPARMTLASRELPCGALVRITGPGGAWVQATVTDRGPAEWTGRRFDLSQATFAAIHDLGAGVITVTVEVLQP